MSSMAGITGTPNLVPYCSSKFAVKGLMDALFLELRFIHNILFYSNFFIDFCHLIYLSSFIIKTLYLGLNFNSEILCTFLITSDLHILTPT